MDAAASAIRGGQADGPWDTEAPRALVADQITNGTGVIHFRTDAERQGLHQHSRPFCCPLKIRRHIVSSGSPASLTA